MHFTMVQIRTIDDNQISARILANGEDKEEVVKRAQAIGTTGVDVICSSMGEGQDIKAALQDAKKKATAYCERIKVDLKGVEWPF